MHIIERDDSRMIDLPGVGPRPRPVDIDQQVTGFSRLKSLRIYAFDPGKVIHGESEADEVFVLPLTGRIGLEITGPHPCRATLDAAGPEHAVYMPPGHDYALSPLERAEVAYARADATARVPTGVVAGTESAGLAEALTFALRVLPAGEALDIGGAGETLCHLARGRGTAGTEPVVAGQTIALPDGATTRLEAQAEMTLLLVSA